MIYDQVRGGGAGFKLLDVISRFILFFLLLPGSTALCRLDFLALLGLLRV